MARVAAILRLLSGERAGLGVNEIARRVGVVPSTCFHILRALADEGFVTFDPADKTYRTSVGLLRLVRDALAAGGFQEAAQPHLDRLARAHDLTAVAVELDNRDHMVVVAIARASSFVSLHVNVGSRFPELISATGRCVAARSGLPRGELRRRFSSLRWENAPAFDDWYAELAQVRTEGVAVDAGHYARGITVLATLLATEREVTIRGLALIGLEHQMTAGLLGRLKDEIIHAAADVAARLG